MEPERRIEKLLRAFAKKRREQAPESMELHSAVRQQLHREIARRAEGRAGGNFFGKLFSGFRPRLGFAVGVVAVVVVLGFFLLPLMNGPKSNSLSMSKLDVGNVPPVEVTPPVSTPAPTVAAPPPAPQKPVEVSKDIAAQKNFAAKMAAVSASPPSTQTLAFKTEGAARSFGGGAIVNNKAPAQPMPRAASAPSVNASAPPATLALNEKEKKNLVIQTAPASSATDGVTFYSLAKSEAAAPQSVTAQHFYRLNLPANSPRAAVASPALVLASFRVEQKGDQLRVVDGDGSVYTGAVQVARAEGVPYGLEAATAQNKSDAFLEDRTRAASAVGNYFFRVTGTNRNLKQNVVFTGNFIPLTNTAPRQTNVGSVGGTIAAARRAAPEPSGPPVSLLNARISGKVTIGDQKEIEVNAAPAK